MFSKKPEQAPVIRQNRRASDKSMGGNSTFSVIGSDVTIKGDVSASTELHVDGRIEGDIECASLVQGEDSVIMGGITAESARMAGTVTGSIAARDLVILRSAKIEGDVHYDALTIEQGAVVEGRFAPRGNNAAAAPSLGSKDAAKNAGDDEPKLTIAN